MEAKRSQVLSPITTIRRKSKMKYGRTFNFSAGPAMMPEPVLEEIRDEMMNNPNTHQNCEKCLGGHFVNCMKGKCIHGSTAKSAIGMMEAEFWKCATDAVTKTISTTRLKWWIIFHA